MVQGGRSIQREESVGSSVERASTTPLQGESTLIKATPAVIGAVTTLNINIEGKAEPLPPPPPQQQQQQQQQHEESGGGDNWLGNGKDGRTSFDVGEDFESF